MRAEWERVEAPTRPVLLINPRSGDGKAARSALADRARERGVEPVVLEPGDDLATLVRAAVDKGADALGMAGGDGSLATVAAAAVDHDLPFVCVPAGTRNHFALDVGVARRDVVGALDAFTDGVERRIDIAEVNGRPFLNNLSLGVYGDAVQRSDYRDAKLQTLLDTLHEVLSSNAPTPELLVTDDAARSHSAPLLALVSNNAYAVGQPGAAGSRPRLDTGRLGVIVLERRRDLPRPGIHSPAISSWTAPTLEIAATGAVPAGIDGEAVVLDPPLRCTIRPAALRVRISRRHPGVSPAALLSRADRSVSS